MNYTSKAEKDDKSQAKAGILLSNYDILKEDPIAYADAIRDIILQLSSEEPELAIKCWSDLLSAHFEEIKSETESADPNGYEYGIFCYYYICQLEGIVDEHSFKPAIYAFSSDVFLLRCLYEISPLGDPCLSAYYPLSYLIRREAFEGAGNILTALYKNDTFSKYSELWERVVDQFKYFDGDDHSDSGPTLYELRQNAAVQGFCTHWINMIEDPKEKAAAMSFILNIF